MTQSIKDLQTQLANRIAELDLERQENAKRNKEERERMVLELEMERQDRLEKYKAKVEAHEKEQRAKEAAAEARKQAETAERLATEHKQNALDEALRVQREKLEWLKRAISEAEFKEEQHRKALEDSRISPSPLEDTAGVCVEYPQTCASGGEAAAGTEGSTPDTPLMSPHLKSILRQINKV